MARKPFLLMAGAALAGLALGAAGVEASYRDLLREAQAQAAGKPVLIKFYAEW